MRQKIRWLMTSTLAACLALPSAAMATNAMVLIGYGTKSRGAGGIAIASPQDSLAAATNPATMGFVKSRVDVGADFFFPKAEAELGDFQEQSQYDKYLMPAMGGVYNFNRKVSMGFTAIPWGGGGTRYNFNLYNASSGSNPDVTMGVELLSMQMAPSISYKFNKQNSVAASLVIGVQRFRAFGLEYFENFTATGLGSTGLTGNGNDYSYGAGARIGWMGQYLDKRLSLGAVYTSKIYQTEFDDYDELFAEQGDLDSPPQAGLGISYKFTDDLTVGFDVLKTFYSEVAAINNQSAQKGPGSVFPNGDEKHRLGNDEGLGFGWDDQIAYKLGVLYDWNEKLTLRAGWNYGKSPVNEKNGEVLMAMVAPAITQHHATIGATYMPNKRTELSFSFVHAFKYEQEGPTFIGNTGRIQMDQNSLGVSFGYTL